MGAKEKIFSFMDNLRGKSLTIDQCKILCTENNIQPEELYKHIHSWANRNNVEVKEV